MKPVMLVVVFTALASATPARGQTLPDQSELSAILQDHVRGSLVDYAALQRDRRRLAIYLDRIGRTSPTALDLAGRDARLAFWINAYNACALQLVIDHYPLDRRGGVAGSAPRGAGAPANSIRRVPDAWERAFCRVAQQDRSLAGIEHGIIRPLGDPRSHFAVACPARSCADLAATAYTADALQAELDAAVRRFIADPRHYRLESDGEPVLRLSRMLDWYQDDFNGTTGVLELLARYAPGGDAAVLRSGRIRVEYMDYDWTLNDTAVFGATGS